VRRPATGWAMTWPSAKIVMTQALQRRGAARSSVSCFTETDTIVNCMTTVSRERVSSAKMR